MIEKLSERLKSGKSHNFQVALLGSDSLLCQAMRSLRVDVENENQNQDFSLEGLADLLNEQIQLEADKPGGQNRSVLLDMLRVSQSSGESDEELEARFKKALALLTAVYYALQTAKRISNPATDDQLDSMLQRLFDSLHDGFGFDAPGNGLVWGTGEHRASRDSNSVADHFEQLKEQQHEAVYWMAYDLLDRWVSRENRDREKIRTASTTIVGAATSVAHLFTLTVELIESAKGPINPDLFYVGLTDVSDVTKHFEKVWNACGLSQWFRCRWRIEFNDETRQVPGVDVNGKYISKLHGNSAQASCLAAILAACGDPYLMKSINAVSDFPPPEKIALDVAVSAAVDYNQQPQSVKELSLKKVGSVPEKLEKTRSLLDFLVLFRDEQKTEKINQLKAARKTHDDWPTSILADKPVGIEDASTVENVLDLLLESNQYLNAYRESIQDAWLKQWEVDTGRFPGQPNAVEGDPDFNNRPTEESVEASND